MRRSRNRSRWPSLCPESAPHGQFSELSRADCVDGIDHAVRHAIGSGGPDVDPAALGESRCGRAGWEWRRGARRPARGGPQPASYGGPSLGDPPFDLGDPLLEGGVVGDGHEVGQDGAGGLELDGFGLGAPGQADDLIGRGGGVAAEASDGAVDGASADVEDLLADFGGACPGVSGALGTLMGPGPGDDGAAAGDGQGEDGRLVAVVPQVHRRCDRCTARGSRAGARSAG